MSTTQKKVQARIKKLFKNLAKDFSIEKLSKTSARFNLKKLDWFNKEYIKMLSLEEFVYRSQQLKIEKSFNLLENLEYKDLQDLRQINCFYLVNFETQKILTFIKDCCYLPFEVENKLEEKIDFTNLAGYLKNFADLKFQENLEKIKNSLGVDITKWQKNKLELPAFLDFRDENYKLTFFSNYVLPVDNEKGEFLENLSINNNHLQQALWLDLKVFLAKQKYLKFCIWKEFCQQNNLTCCQVNLQILQEYLAWNLDKNRVTTLSEVG